MGEFGGGERYGDNPFIYFEASEYLVQPQQKNEMPNPLKAMYEEIAPLLLRSPPSKRYPQQPTGMKGWDILTDQPSLTLFLVKHFNGLCGPQWKEKKDWRLT